MSASKVLRRHLGLLGILCGCACSPSGDANETEERVLEGFGGLVLGSSLEEAIAVVRASDFNAVGLRECLESMPIRGCFLPPASGHPTFQRIEGIPYALQLAFNRFGVLTDIDLRFDRGFGGNRGSTSISREQCLDIVERTVDWVSTEYGAMDPTRSQERQEDASETSEGNTYWLERTEEGPDFIVTGAVAMAEGRTVRIFAHNLEWDDQADCSVKVSFAEAPEIERRLSRPDSD